MIITKKEKAFAKIFELNTYDDLIQNLIYNEDNWIKSREIETKLISKLIENNISTDRITEFTDVFYVDKDKLYPTVSESFAKDGKEAQILSTNTNNKTIGNIYIKNVSECNPYGEYSIYRLPKQKYNIIPPKCFVIEKEMPFLKEHIIDWTNNGISCVYTVSGTLDKKLQLNEKESKKYVDELIKDTNVSYNEKFSYDKENNIYAKVYIMKKATTL